MKKLALLPLFFALGVAHVLGQTCNYLAYESFSYPANAPLNGQQGGTGWESPWNVQNGNVTVPGFQSASGLPMNFLNLQTSGNYASGGYQYLTAGRRLNTATGGPFEDYLTANNTIGLAGTTLFVSGLLRKKEDNDEEIWLDWHDQNLSWCTGCTSNEVAFGYFGTNSNVGGQRRWTLQVRNNFYPTAIPVAVNETVFFVIRLDFNATTTGISLYVNPSSIGNSMPASPTMTQTAATPIEIRSVASYMGDNPASGETDEIRMAVSWACATPDPSVMVNLPPIAAFSMTPATGNAPLSVTLDATASTDPDGSIANYSWNFGDGSANGTGQTVTHIYNDVGILNVQLTVTDNLGLSHSIVLPITILDENNTFSCLLRLGGIQLATCTAATGRVEVANPPGAALILRNAMNATVPPAPGNPNLYQNLSTGLYSLTAAGANGCRDTFALTVAVDSQTCAGWSPNPCAMKIGTGLEGLAYWTPQRVFKNFYRDADRWITYDPLDFNTWNSNQYSQIPLDENGYPTVIPFSSPTGLRNVRGVMSASGHIPVGVPMRLLYDGTGTLVMQGPVSIQNSAPGQIDFTATVADNIFFNMTFSQSGNHVRNIRVVAISDLGSYQIQPFRQSFLEKCSLFTSLRMMDFMATNGNDNVEWANRTLPNWYTQAASPNGGIAYEHIIQLANTLNKDIWVCVPHMASEDYIQKMAELFRDGLNPGLKVYLEYSNETWNWIFEQALWVDQNGPNNLSYVRKYVMRAQNAFQIWHAAWGAENGRVVRVLGTQNGYDFVSEEILSHADPDLYDAISPSWYFGLNHSASGNPNLQALGASATVADVLQNATNTFLGFYPSWQMIYRSAKMFNKKVINYEGGQHFTDFGVPPYIQAMYDAQVHPDMYTLYDRALDSLRRLGSEMPMAFVMVGPHESIYGSWGHLHDTDDPAPWNDRPKHQTLMDHIALCPPVAPPSGVRLSPKVFLQGPFSTATGLMADNLRAGNLLPTTSPYGDGRTTTADILAATGQNAIVDWVIVELRDKNAPATVLHFRSALIQRDGQIVDMDGRSPVFFSGVAADNYFVAVRHRNHLGFRSLTALPLNNFAAFLNFADGELPTFGTEALKNISGKYAMWSGDANGNGNINAVDLNAHWRLQNGQTFNYSTSNADFNLSGFVNAVDLNAHWRPNNSRVQQL